MTSKYKIYKLEIPECPVHTYEVGVRRVTSITEDIRQIAYSPDGGASRLIYIIAFAGGKTIEISGDIKGLVIHRQF